MSDDDPTTKTIWKFENSRFEAYDLEWAIGEGLEENLEQHHANLDSPLFFGDSDLKVYAQGVVRPTGYFAIHEIGYATEIVYCPSYPALLAYLTIAVPPVMAFQHTVEIERIRESLDAIAKVVANRENHNPEV